MEPLDHQGYNEYATNKVSLMAILYRMLRNWYWFAILAILMVGAAWLYLRYTIPVYDTSMKILIKEDERGDMVSMSSARFNRSFFSQHYFVANEIEVLRSVDLMRSVVEELELNIKYFTIGRLKTSESYKHYPVKLDFVDSLELFEGHSFLIKELNEKECRVVVNSLDTLSIKYGNVTNYDGKAFRIFRNFTPDTDILVKVEDPDMVGGSISGALSIKPVKQSEVLMVSMTDHLPNRSLDALSGLIKAYNLTTLKSKNSSTYKTVDFIDERLQFITNELFDVEKEVEVFKRENKVPITIDQTAQLFLEKVSSSDEALAQLELEESLLSGADEVLRDRQPGYSMLPVNLSDGDENVSLVGDYNLLVQQRDRLLLSAKPENPNVKAINDQLENLKANILRWIKLKREEIRERRDFLQKKINPFEERIASIPRYEREFIQIMRQQKIKETIFTFLLQRREETALLLASEVSNTRIIDEPRVGMAVSPNSKRVYIFFFLLAISIPAIYILLLEYFDTRIYSKSDITSIIDAPFMGSIVNIGKDSKIIIEEGSRSVIAESIRLLRSNLNFLVKSADKYTVLMTSSISGEGKTFLSLNLAASLAFSGKKVVVVGMDLRKPKLSLYLNGTRAEIGVANYLIGQNQNLEELCIPVQGYDGLFIMDGGPVPPNPSELIMGSNMPKLLNSLKESFDYVIIDSPPVGLVADAYSFKEHVDCTLYVTRHGLTRKPQLSTLMDAYFNKKLPNLAVILNGVEQGIGYGYSSYGYYDEDLTWFERIKRKFSGSI